MNLKQYLPYVNALMSLKLDFDSKERAVALAVGAAVAYSIQLPGSEVESPQAYYVSNVAIALASSVSQFNEAGVFNTRAAVDFGRKVWLHRYYSVYGRPTGIQPGSDFLLSITGAKMIFSPEDLTLAERVSPEAICVFNACREVLAAMAAEQKAQALSQDSTLPSTPVYQAA